MNNSELNQVLIESGLFHDIVDAPVPGMNLLDNAARAREIHNRIKDMLLQTGDDENSGAVPALLVTFVDHAGPETEPYPTYVMMPNMQKKNEVFELLRLANKRNGCLVEQITLTTTAWIGRMQGKSMEDLPEGYRPSTDPERREALITYSQDADGMKYIYCDKLVRDENNKIISFEDSIVPGTDESARFESPVFDLGSWRSGEQGNVSWH